MGGMDHLLYIYLFFIYFLFIYLSIIPPFSFPQAFNSLEGKLSSDNKKGVGGRRTRGGKAGFGGALAAVAARVTGGGGGGGGGKSGSAQEKEKAAAQVCPISFLSVLVCASRWRYLIHPPSLPPSLPPSPTGSIHPSPRRPPL
jgi:hypothetical protein